MPLRTTHLAATLWVVSLLIGGTHTCPGDHGDSGEGPPEGLYGRRVNQVGLEEVYLRVGALWVLEVRAPAGVEDRRLLYRQVGSLGIYFT